MRRADAAWTVAMAAGAVVAAEWARVPGWILAGGIAPLAALAVLALRREAGEESAPRLLARAGVLLLAGTMAALLVGTVRLRRVEHRWPALREAAITGASRRLSGELDAAVHAVWSLAERSAPALELEPPAAFAALDREIGAGGASRGVALFRRDGHAYAWAGLHRTTLTPDGPDLAAVTTPFYLWLVARRQTAAGTAVAAVLLARSEDVPPVGVAVADRFAARTGVGLRFLDARTAPGDSDVFDYVRPGGAGGDTLFAVQPVPPEQGAARAAALGAARRTATIAALLLVMVASAGAMRRAVALPWALAGPLAGFVVLARAPLGAAFGSGSVFWPDTYFESLLGPYSASAGALLASGTLAFALGAALWRRGLRATRPRVAVAVAITLLAPYLLRGLARGISPPASGVTPAHWLLWETALAVPASAIILLAAALVRGTAPPTGRRRAIPAPLIAAALAVAGLWWWAPGTNWPEWYPYLWTPALLLAIRPMPFGRAIAGIAVVAGSSAALLAWGATTEGRVALATRDLEGLGSRPDPIAVALLDRFARTAPSRDAPAGAGELYLLWRRSALAAQGYPAALALWRPDGTRAAAFDLAELLVPEDVVHAVALEASQVGLPVVRPVLYSPGLHGVAAVPLGDGRVATVTVGPRTRLLPPTRLQRALLATGVEAEPLYDVAIGPALRTGPRDSVASWRRSGWTLRGERRVDLPDGPRHAHAVIDLRGPSVLLQRGALVLLFDVALLALLAAVVEGLAGRAGPAVRRWWPAGSRSLRLRLAVTLAVFFVLPTVLFAAWSLRRLENEFRGARVLLLQRTLRDAAALLSDEATPVAATAQRLDAELFVSRGGALVAASAPVLTELGLADRLVPAPVFRRLAFADELELTAALDAVPAATLIGYRLLDRPEEGPVTILAATEPLGERALRRREADLGIAVLLVSALGCLAAVLLSTLAARALAEPLQRLRHDALALGAGTPPTVEAGSVPVELEPIRGALAQAAADVEAGQRAQRVLAWGEMARQVAHEIKNPLTPIRLGVQHLLRVNRERPAELPTVLEPTGERILAEIERLDHIARGFSRLGLPGSEGGPLEAVDLAAVADEVVRLYRMSGGSGRWEVEAAPARGLARRDELVEVLVNLCENARDAGARRVVVRTGVAAGRPVVEVQDDGRGITAEVLPRVFEPRFSTTTSGAGLGLAIAKRLVEGWGGTIGVRSAVGEGTTVRLGLHRSDG